MKCPGCGAAITCPEHGDAGLAYLPEPACVYCGPCVDAYGSPIGSVRHDCEDLFAHLRAVATHPEWIEKALEEVRNG